MDKKLVASRVEAEVVKIAEAMGLDVTKKSELDVARSLLGQKLLAVLPGLTAKVIEGIKADQAAATGAEVAAS